MLCLAMPAILQRALERPRRAVLQHLHRSDIVCRGLFISGGTLDGRGKLSRRIAQQQRHAANDGDKGKTQNHHGGMQTVLPQQVLAQGSKINRSDTETGNDNPGDQAGFRGGKPFQGRRGRCGIAESDTDAGQHAETKNPFPVARGLGADQETGTDQKTAQEGCQFRPDLILHFATRSHGQGENQAGSCIGIAGTRKQVGNFPLEHTVSVKNA